MASSTHKPSADLKDQKNTTEQPSAFMTSSSTHKPSADLKNQKNATEQPSAFKTFTVFSASAQKADTKASNPENLAALSQAVKQLYVGDNKNYESIMIDVGHGNSYSDPKFIYYVRFRRPIEFQDGFAAATSRQKLVAKLGQGYDIVIACVNQYLDTTYYMTETMFAEFGANVENLIKPKPQPQAPNF